MVDDRLRVLLPVLLPWPQSFIIQYGLIPQVLEVTGTVSLSLFSVHWRTTPQFYTVQWWVWVWARRRRRTSAHRPNKNAAHRVNICGFPGAVMERSVIPGWGSRMCQHSDLQGCNWRRQRSPKRTHTHTHTVPLPSLHAGELCNYTNVCTVSGAGRVCLCVSNTWVTN